MDGARQGGGAQPSRQSLGVGNWREIEWKQANPIVPSSRKCQFCSTRRDRVKMHNCTQPLRTRRVGVELVRVPHPCAHASTCQGPTGVVEPRRLPPWHWLRRWRIGFSEQFTQRHGSGLRPSGYLHCLQQTLQPISVQIPLKKASPRPKFQK